MISFFSFRSRIQNYLTCAFSDSPSPVAPYLVTSKTVGPRSARPQKSKVARPTKKTVILATSSNLLTRAIVALNPELAVFQLILERSIKKQRLVENQLTNICSTYLCTFLTPQSYLRQLLAERKEGKPYWGWLAPLFFLVKANVNRCQKVWGELMTFIPKVWWTTILILDIHDLFPFSIEIFTSNLHILWSNIHLFFI